MLNFVDDDAVAMIHISQQTQTTMQTL